MPNMGSDSQAIELSLVDLIDGEGQDVSSDSIGYPVGWKLWIIILSLLLGTFLVAIDGTMIGIVVPKISTIFNALDDVDWYVWAYLITITALQPAFGIIYRDFNVKSVYLISLLVFEGS